MGPKSDRDSQPEADYRHANPHTDQALDWFVRLRSQDADPATQAEFERWLAADSRHRDAFAALERMHAMPSLRKATQRDADMRANAGARRATSRSGYSVRQWGIGAAAAAVLAFAVLHVPSLIQRWNADYVTAAGETRRVTLPDGSTMTLNTASAVALDFEAGKRQVRLLAGEAFFEVRNAGGKPFVVTASVSEAEVKGTAFAVRTDDSLDSVLLDHGLVDVRRTADPRDGVALKAGQMTTSSADKISPAAAFDVKNSLSWLQGRIVFRNQPFDRALNELRRYYSGTVIVVTGRLSDARVNGNYSVGDGRAAIRTLAESVDASVISLPGGILILR